MSRIEKTGRLRKKQADAKTDIALVNQYSIRELTPEEVYCCSIVLCDNEVDRDGERFPKKTLQRLAPLFLGKTGLFDHRWSAKQQIARLYRTEVQKTEEINSLGEPYYVLRGDAYLLQNEENQGIIHAIDGGILKEVSVGCAVGDCVCSICGEPLRYDWRSGEYQCKNEHSKGKEYEGKLCVGELVEPKDAYEFSFVAVPAQPGAGVRKSAAEVEGAFRLLLSKDLREYEALAKRLLSHCQAALEGAEERQARQKILAENKAFLRKA